MRAIIVALGVTAIGVWSAGGALAVDLMYGCCNRPACGKVCKLVCEPTKLVAVGYGCECKEICIPGPSRCGCKHCETRCCCDNELKGCPPKIEFCWHDWFACGCARPRTIRVLTKYQAVKKIPYFHWEVVDGCNCCCPGPCHCVYKPAPAEAQVGDVLELNEDEQVEVTSYLSSDPIFGVVPVDAAKSSVNELPAANAVDAPSADEPAKPTARERLTKLWPFAAEAN